MMTCRQVRETLTLNEREAIAPVTWRAIEAHVAGCAACKQHLQWLELVDDGLQRQVIPPPRDDFEQRVMAMAVGGSAASRQLKTRWKTSAAIAATLVIGIVIGLGLGRQSSQQAQVPDVAAVSHDETREQTVRLAFNARQNLNDVQLTIELPPNVELKAFPGRRVLSWDVSLKSGENVIALPLRVIYPQRGELLAHLDNGQHRKTFRAPIPGINEDN